MSDGTILGAILGCALFGAALLAWGMIHGINAEHSDRARIVKLEAEVACFQHGPQRVQPGCVR